MSRAATYHALTIIAGARQLIMIGALLCLLAPGIANAHKESDAYLTLRADADNPHQLHGQWDIALRDLNFVLGIDSDRDGAITWGEVKTHRSAIERYALARIAVTGDGLTCPLAATGQQFDTHTDGGYNVILFDARCKQDEPSTIGITYRLFDDVDPYHRGIVTLRADANTTSAVLGPDDNHVELSADAPDRWQQFRSFVYDGMWHIWQGFDHMLFILSLLLPSVLVRRAVRRAWAPVERLRPAFIEIVKIISAFTVSHSLTLTLAVLGYVALPSWLVESGIALSIVLAALNNLYPVVDKRIWLVAFGFGFIHGLGFAGALAGLNLPAGAMAASLGGFNVGVEIGQEAVVILLMPIAFILRRTRFYRVGVVRIGSAAIALIALGWLIQRACNVQIPIFSAILPG